MRLVQIANGSERRTAVVQEPRLTLLESVESVLSLAQQALATGIALSALARARISNETLNYDEVYQGKSAWKLLGPIDAPGDPRRVQVSGTGLTHLGSARDRQAMHIAPSKQEEEQMTDSMRIFEWGMREGKPADGAIGIAPEWFFKGDGSIVQPPFSALEIPGYAEDGGEEAEIAAIYLIAGDGAPCRIGMAAGNEFSDHVFERRNYLNLAGSKLRMCSIGPELILDSSFDDVAGEVRILREGKTVWEKRIRTGERNMCHSLANIEHHHFKFEGHRRPGMVHIHFLGADCLSFGAGVRLRPGDVTEIAFEGFGRPLQNTITRGEPLTKALRVSPMQ